MKRLLFTLLLSPLAQAAISEADPSFRLQIDKDDMPTYCQALRLASGKSEMCFATTARDCLPNPEKKSGKLEIRSAEIGRHAAEYEAKGEVAVLNWKCGGTEFHIPPMTVSHKKLSSKDTALYAVGGKQIQDPRVLYPGKIVETDGKSLVVKTTRHQSRRDLGSPLLCSTKNGEGDICGILVAPEQSRYAVGESLSFIHERMRLFGAKNRFEMTEEIYEAPHCVD